MNDEMYQGMFYSMTKSAGAGAEVGKGIYAGLKKMVSGGKEGLTHAKDLLARRAKNTKSLVAAGYTPASAKMTMGSAPSRVGRALKGAGGAFKKLDPEQQRKMLLAGGGVAGGVGLGTGLALG